MELIEGAVKEYDWGLLTAIPDLLGRSATGEPWAEVPGPLGQRRARRPDIQAHRPRRAVANRRLRRRAGAGAAAAVAAGVAACRTGAAEFSLRRLDIDGSVELPAAGPAVLLCTDGCVEADNVTLDRGTAAWSGAHEPEVALAGRGTVYCAGVGQDAQRHGLL